ncbi:MAG: type II secretion system F family protein [Pirellulales bacterium]|nr:type II secretion system F family protein [Pirellulales bacterium]
MNPQFLLVIVGVFATSGGLMLAVGLALRDAQRKEAKFQRRLGNGIHQPEPTPEILAREATNWLDRRFYLLLERSGSRLSVISALTVLIAAAAIGCTLGLVVLEDFLAGVVGLFLGALLPLGWWGSQKVRRLKKMQRELPGALDMLADALHAGQTLERAAELVAAQIPAPLKDEFSHCVAMLRLGHSPVAVMERMARRIPLPEFQVFATAVLVHRQTGGNLAQLTTRLAGAARDRQEFFSHLGAQTVAARYSAIGLVTAATLGLAVLVMARPEYLAFFLQSELGPGLLIAAGALLLFGTLWMWRVANVKY